MRDMPAGEATLVSLVRQLSSGETWSKRHLPDQKNLSCTMQGLNLCNTEDNNGGGGGGVVGKKKKKKRVMVVVDNSARAKQAVVWALTHVTARGDLLTLLHMVPPAAAAAVAAAGGEEISDAVVDSSQLATALVSLCKTSRSEIEVETLLIHGMGAATVTGQVKKLGASVLVLAQRKPSPLFSCLYRSSSEDLVDECIKHAECLTLAVRKQSKSIGGYLVTTKWQKNFWLLA